MAMTSLQFTFLAILSGGVCSAGEVPPSTFSLAIPELRIPSPQFRRIPASIRMPVPSPTKMPAYHLEITMFCGGVFEYEEPSPLGLIELFGSVADFRHALGSEEVEVVELRPNADIFVPSAEYVDRVVALPSGDATTVRAILTCDSSFNWRNTPKVDSRPDVRVKFKKSGRVVALDLFLATRCTRLVKEGYVGAPISIEFGFEALLAILETHFPGVTGSKG